MVYRPQLNVLQRVPPRKDGLEEDSPTWTESEGSKEGSWTCNNGSLSDQIKAIDEQIAELKVGGDDQALKKLPKQATDNEQDSDWEVVSNPDKSKKKESVAITPGESTMNLEEYQKIVYGKWTWDPEHSQHATMHWSACYTSYCRYHYDSSGARGYIPRIRCNAIGWDYCQNIECEFHLASKRNNERFPGSAPRWEEALWTRLKRERDTGECHLYEWYACLHNKCQKHMRQKQLAGFLPKQGKEYSLVLGVSTRRSMY